VKVDGERAYKRARRGEAVAPASRQVEVHELALSRWAPPEFDFRATVGAGTYVRALIRDVGRTLGCGAHLTRLVRTAVGPFRLADAVAADDLTPAAARNPDLLVAELPRRELSAGERTAVTHGRPVPAADAGAGAQVALFAAGSLIAVAERAEQDGAAILKPRVVVAEP
jgi:tRNA pseudouridine55 synthase